MIHIKQTLIKAYWRDLKLFKQSSPITVMQRPTLLTAYLDGWSSGTLSVQSTASARHPITQSQVALAHTSSQ